ncbi:HupE/UreJ family protein [Rhodobacteraceae bacterium B1Z28]|uniref:HupE/UreJ family protein n=1 Tax=Ruegeria haliotis TaxID=2747601 RepID=A0ABX2PP03_9RHOB|nr:HupE/UreJ family protein [Ruegeria haliotis]NVO55411.1 HupE/UreJ family protein [Ruegeria haliotis]
MSRGVILAILHRLKFCLLSFVAVMTLLPGQGAAQSPAPTIIDFWIKSDTLFLEISLNAEAFLAGVDPSSTEGNQQYKDLRALVSSELEPQVKEFVQTWKQSLQVEAGGVVALSYEGIRIPVTGDLQTVRVSKLLLAGPIPKGASTLRLRWPEGFGPVVLRQQRASAPYTGYLAAGETSPSIPLYGGAALSTQQTLQAFFPKGVTQILPNSPKQVLLALVLVFLSLHVRPLVAQLLLLSLGVVIGLGLGMSEAVTVPRPVVTQSLTMAIVVLALWNLISRRLQVWRLLTVCAVGALQGIGLSFVLTAIGAPPDHIPQAVLGFGAGVIATLCAVACAAFGVAVLVSGRSHRLRGRISVLASMIIAGVGVYWMVEPWLMT